MVKYSLICATIGRQRELDNLLSSLSKQTYNDFELIIVDQNEQGFLDEIIDKYKDKLLIKHVYALPRGASTARNLGVSYAEGDILGFPDDDCEYPVELLSLINNQFAREPQVVAFSGVCRSRQSLELAASRYGHGQKVLNKYNMWTRHILACMFIRKAIFDAVGGFDPRLGVGTKHGSGEESDLLLRILYNNHRVLFDSTVYVFHPDPAKGGSKSSLKRAFGYGLGWGALFHKHILFHKQAGLTPLYAYFLLRSAVGSFVALITFRIGLANFHAHSLAGRVAGFFTFR